MSLTEQTKNLDSQIIAGLEAADNPSASNPVATISDLTEPTIKSQVLQDSSNWVGNGQSIKNGGSPFFDASWIDFASEDFDTNAIHDNTVYDSGTATGTQSTTTLQDTSKAWTVNEWAGYTVKITGGTNGDDVAKIISNTADTLTVDDPWITTVASGSSTYEITLRCRFTIPEDGLYVISPRLTFSANANVSFGTYIYKNNVFYNSFFFALGINIETAVPYPPEYMDLLAGDYIEIKGYAGQSGESLLSFGNRVRNTVVKIGN